MADTNIGWCSKVWNPLVGCSITSPGCTNCYALAMANRLERMGMERYQGATKLVNGHAVWTGEVRFVDEVLIKPLHWRKPRKIFVNSMSDLFHESVRNDWIDQILATIALAGALGRGHIFQILTKRAKGMHESMNYPASWWADRLSSVAQKVYGDDAEAHVYNSITNQLGEGHNVGWPMRNLWLGVSVEDQPRLERITWLRETPAVIRFLSLEPLLQDLSSINLNRISWCIIGGESGPGYRPMEMAWLESIVAQCQAAGVNVFVKQAAALRPGQQGKISDALWRLKEMP